MLLPVGLCYSRFVICYYNIDYLVASFHVVIESHWFVAGVYWWSFYSFGIKNCSIIVLCWCFDSFIMMFVYSDVFILKHYASIVFFWYFGYFIAKVLDGIYQFSYLYPLSHWCCMDVCYYHHCAEKPVTTMLTYPWKCTVLHCNHLGNTWKPLVLMI